MIQDGKLRGFAMGHAIPVRTDYTAGEVRRFAQRAKDAAQARRLLAIAAVLEGASREEAAKIGGMDRQTLRDWVTRFNEQGADGLINIPSPGMPPKLNAIHKAFLARIVEEGPIAAIHGVVRWRACDLIMRRHEEFGLSVSDDTIYRALKTLGFSHVSARPKAYRQNADAMDAFKKNFAERVAEIRAQLAPDTPVEVWFQMLWGAATMQSLDNVNPTIYLVIELSASSCLIVARVPGSEKPHLHRIDGGNT